VVLHHLSLKLEKATTLIQNAVDPSDKTWSVKYVFETYLVRKIEAELIFLLFMN
jgi:hypothetical protein